MNWVDLLGFGQSFTFFSRVESNVQREASRVRGWFRRPWGYAKTPRIGFARATPARHQFAMTGSQMARTTAAALAQLDLSPRWLGDGDPASAAAARPRTSDQDIDQPSGTLLPVGASRDVGYADKGPKEINRVEVLTYVATGDRALH